MSMNDTPRANRLHIGIFGRRNAGKSSLINALTGQELAIVSHTPGTTADPVFKAMELHPAGPVVFIDTAGFDDEGELGSLRVAKTSQVVDRTDVAVLVLDGPELAAGAWMRAEPENGGDGEREADCPEHEVDCAEHEDAGVKREMGDAEHGNTEPKDEPVLQQEREWIARLHAAKVPVIIAINKWEQLNERGRRIVMREAARLDGVPVIPVSAKTGEGIDVLRRIITGAVPEDYMRERIIGDLVEDGGLVLLVMPQDIQAPKGRLILPQVQTIRELLDRRCSVMSVTADGLERALADLRRAPDLIITDSQCFGQVYESKPAVSRLTSFSILMAASKGDIGVFAEGVQAIDRALANRTAGTAVGAASGQEDASERHLAPGQGFVPEQISEPGPFRVLIAEACTHVPQNEDIGTVKIPRLLRAAFGENGRCDPAENPAPAGSMEDNAVPGYPGQKVLIRNVRGSDFPDVEELRKYDLIIHCGACMFNRHHVMRRIAMAREAGVPITNYGIFLAKMTGILEKVSLPE